MDKPPMKRPKAKALSSHKMENNMTPSNILGLILSDQDCKSRPEKEKNIVELQSLENLSNEKCLAYSNLLVIVSKVMSNLETGLNSWSEEVLNESKQNSNFENPVSKLLNECFNDECVKTPNGESAISNCDEIHRFVYECLEVINTVVMRCSNDLKVLNIITGTSRIKQAKKLLRHMMITIQNCLCTSPTVVRMLSSEFQQQYERFVFNLLDYLITEVINLLKSAILNLHSTSKSQNSHVTIPKIKSKFDKVGFDQHNQHWKKSECLESMKREIDLPINQNNVDCYSCFAGYDNRDILVKAVSKFAEEIKRELFLNHKRGMCSQNGLHDSDSRISSKKKLCTSSSTVEPTNKQQCNGCKKLSRYDGSDRGRLLFEKLFKENDCGSRAGDWGDGLLRDTTKSTQIQKYLAPSTQCKRDQLHLQHRFKNVLPSGHPSQKVQVMLAKNVPDSQLSGGAIKPTDQSLVTTSQSGNKEPEIRNQGNAKTGLGKGKLSLSNLFKKKNSKKVANPADSSKILSNSQTGKDHHRSENHDASLWNDRGNFENDPNRDLLAESVVLHPNSNEFLTQQENERAKHKPNDGNRNLSATNQKTVNHSSKPRLIPLQEKVSISDIRRSKPESNLAVVKNTNQIEGAHDFSNYKVENTEPFHTPPCDCTVKTLENMKNSPHRPIFQFFTSPVTMCNCNLPNVVTDGPEHTQSHQSLTCNKRQDKLMENTDIKTEPSSVRMVTQVVPNSQQPQPFASKSLENTDIETQTSSVRIIHQVVPTPQTAQPFPSKSMENADIETQTSSVRIVPPAVPTPQTAQPFPSKSMDNADIETQTSSVRIVPPAVPTPQTPQPLAPKSMVNTDIQTQTSSVLIPQAVPDPQTPQPSASKSMGNTDIETQTSSARILPQAVPSPQELQPLASASTESSPFMIGSTSSVKTGFPKSASSAQPTASQETTHENSTLSGTPTNVHCSKDGGQSLCYDCTCSRRIEARFDEFDQKYSRVVEEIKSLVKQGSIPVENSCQSYPGGTPLTPLASTTSKNNGLPSLGVISPSQTLTRSATTEPSIETPTSKEKFIDPPHIGPSISQIYSDPKKWAHQREPDTLPGGDRNFSVGQEQCICPKLSDHLPHSQENVRLPQPSASVFLHCRCCKCGNGSNSEVKQIYMVGHTIHESAHQKGGKPLGKMGNCDLPECYELCRFRKGKPSNTPKLQPTTTLINEKSDYEDPIIQLIIKSQEATGSALYEEYTNTESLKKENKDKLCTKNNSNPDLKPPPVTSDYYSRSSSTSVLPENSFAQTLSTQSYYLRVESDAVKPSKANKTEYCNKIKKCETNENEYEPQRPTKEPGRTLEESSSAGKPCCSNGNQMGMGESSGFNHQSGFGREKCSNLIQNADVANSKVSSHIVQMLAAEDIGTVINTQLFSTEPNTVDSIGFDEEQHVTEQAGFPVNSKRTVEIKRIFEANKIGSNAQPGQVKLQQQLTRIECEEIHETGNESIACYSTVDLPRFTVARDNHSVRLIQKHSIGGKGPDNNKILNCQNNPENQLSVSPQFCQVNDKDFKIGQKDKFTGNEATHGSRNSSIPQHDVENLEIMKTENYPKAEENNSAGILIDGTLSEEIPGTDSTVSMSSECQSFIDSWHGGHSGEIKAISSKSCGSSLFNPEILNRVIYSSAKAKGRSGSTATSPFIPVPQGVLSRPYSLFDVEVEETKREEHLGKNHQESSPFTVSKARRKVHKSEESLEWYERFNSQLSNIRDPSSISSCWKEEHGEKPKRQVSISSASSLCHTQLGYMVLLGESTSDEKRTSRSESSHRVAEPDHVRNQNHPTKWNAKTQTAGPRKFNRTDISPREEEKMARYLGLKRRGP